MPVVAYETQAAADPPASPHAAVLPVTPTNISASTFVRIKFLLHRVSGDIIRVVRFTEKPSWNEIASRVEALFEIPRSDVAVMYPDR
jgi:hypothetical protein